jgi:hypothetical protein
VRACVRRPALVPALGAAVAGAPWVLRERIGVPPHVERGLRALERDGRRPPPDPVAPPLLRHHDVHRSRRSDRWERIVHGVIGGLNGAACMTTLRMAARRAGLIEKTPPQMLEEWAVARATRRPARDAVTRDVADQLLHVAISASAGAAYAAFKPRRLRDALAGPAFGLVIWAAAFIHLLPALGAVRSPRRATFGEHAVNITAHVLYGVVTALITDEYTRRPRGGVPHLQRHVTRAG